MTLFVVSTPIGNLEDFSFRAKNVLQTVDLIAAEDKRRTAVLLARWSIEKPMVALHDHNEKHLLEKMINFLKSGKTIALVSDSGLRLFLTLVMLSCASAVRKILLLVPYGRLFSNCCPECCRITNQSISFRGFAPTKAKDRTTFLRTMSEEPFTQVFFETPHRITETIAAMSQFLPGRDVVVCRELTKKLNRLFFLELKKFKKCSLPLKSRAKGSL